MHVRRVPAILLIAVVVLAALGAYSYWSAGFVYVLANGTPGDGPWLERVRATVAGWGRLAPLVYTLAVVVEVIVAPIPGTLLYAPAGAIFGGCSAARCRSLATSSAQRSAASSAG